jgi:hypothetical protein
MGYVDKDEVLFCEIQQFRQWWVWLIVSALVAFAAWIFITQIINGIPFGTKPLPDFGVYIVTFILGVGCPALFLLMKMKTIVRGDILIVSFLPFYFKKFPLDDIRDFAVCEFNPFKDFGGWGVRWNPKSGTGIFVSGGRGIRLEMKNGRKITIGSQEPERFADALTAALKSKY